MHATCLILLAILAQASPPTGDPQAKAQAQALLGQGTKLYQQGDVADALEKFQAAYAAFPSPKLIFNIGQANRDLSRPVEALEAFEKFLVGAADASPEMIADARKSVAQLQKKLGRIQVDCESAGAEVSVDGKSVGLAPLPDLIWVTPGRHQVTAKHASAAPAIEDTDVTAGSVSTVTVRLRPPASSLSTPAPNAADFDVQDCTRPGGEGGLVAGQEMDMGSAGSTVLLAVGAITAGTLMDSKFDSLRSSCGAGNPARPGCTQSESIRSIRARPRPTSSGVLPPPPP